MKSTNTFQKKLPLSEEGDYNTLSGFIMHELGDIPEENQEFDFYDYHFKILKMQNKSVELVELTYDPKNIMDTMMDEISEN